MYSEAKAMLNFSARRIVLPLLRFFNRDISIVHRWTGDRVLLRLFEDRGYWFHGRRRERDEMLAVARLLKPGDLVVEVGAHVGYLSVFFSSLVGDDGYVFTFEPSPQNRRLLERNVARLSNVCVASSAFGSVCYSGSICR